MTIGPGDRAAAAGGRGHLRASQADREQVIEILKAAFVQGRLTQDELDTRAGQAFASRTYADLAALTADIPAEPAAVPPTRPTRAQQPGNATVKAGACVITAATILTAGVWAGAFFSPGDNTAVGTLVWAFTFTWLGIVMLVGAVMVDSSRQKPSRGQSPPRPGQRGRGLEGRPGPASDDPALPGSRPDQTRADLRTSRPKRDRRQPSGRGAWVPHGTRSAPGAA